MADDTLGSAWYELGLRDNEFRSKTKAAEDHLRTAAKAGGDAFAREVESGTRRAGNSVDGLVSKVNQLRGKGPEELARALQRAVAEADEAAAAVRRLSESNVDPARARKYADQLNEISIEASQVQADLRELQAADPKFNTPALERAATDLDRIGNEASEAATRLNRMKGVGADTHLERLGQEANEAAGKLDRTKASADGLHGKLLSVKNLLAGAGIFIGAQEVLRFFGDSLEAAAELDARTRGATRVLGEHIDVLQDFAETSAEAWGLSRREVFETGAVLHAQLTNLGFGARDAAGEVVTLQQRASDMAATFGGPVSGAVLAISAVLRGERDTIEKYGVSLKEADVNARILELGLDASTSEARKNAVAIASLDLVMQQTADTQGAFADSAGEAAGELARTRAAVEDLQAEIGDLAAPGQAAGLRFIRDALSAATENWDAATSAAERFHDNLTGMEDEVLRVAELMGVSYQEARDAIVTANDEMGLSAEQFASRLENGLPTTKAALQEQNEAVGKSIDEIIAMYRSADTRAATAEMQRKIIEGIEASWGAIRQAGTDTVREFNVGIFEAQTSLQTEIDSLLTALDTRLAPADEIALLRGRKVDLLLARGIAEEKGDLGAVAAIDDLIAKINAQLAGLSGYGSGANFVRTLADGMNDPAANAYLTRTARAVGGRIRAPLAIFSEPEDRLSPLFGVTQWGGNLDRTIADSVIANAGVLSDAGRVAAGHLRDGLMVDPFGFSGTTAVTSAVAGMASGAPASTTPSGPLGSARNGAVPVQLVLRDGRLLAEVVNYENAIAPPAASLWPGGV